MQTCVNPSLLCLSRTIFFLSFLKKKNNNCCMILLHKLMYEVSQSMYFTPSWPSVWPQFLWCGEYFDLSWEKKDVARTNCNTNTTMTDVKWYSRRNTPQQESVCWKLQHRLPILEVCIWVCLFRFSSFLLQPKDIHFGPTEKPMWAQMANLYQTGNLPRCNSALIPRQLGQSPKMNE